MDDFNDLIKKAQLGSKSAYIGLLKECQVDLYRVAQARLSNIDDINDAINEAIFRAYKYLKTLKQPQYFKTWLIKILINECNNIYNKNQKQTKLKNKHFLENDYSVDDVNDKFDFEIFIENLNYEEKIVVVLFYNSRYTVSEISDILNINVNTVKSRLLRAKEKLKKEIEKDMKFKK